LCAVSPVISRHFKLHVVQNFVGFGIVDVIQSCFNSYFTKSSSKRAEFVWHALLDIACNFKLECYVKLIA
jgi:hypothetical protein